jgi:hypothetical protein
MKGRIRIRYPYGQGIAAGGLMYMEMSWDDFLIVALFALSVLGPIFVVLLTQNILGPGDEVGAQHYDADGANADPANLPTGAGARGGPDPQ